MMTPTAPAGGFLTVNDSHVARGIYPPRPNAIITYLPSSSWSSSSSSSSVSSASKNNDVDNGNDYIPRIQALLYSLYKTTKTTQSRSSTKAVTVTKNSRSSSSSSNSDKNLGSTDNGGDTYGNNHYLPEVVVVVGAKSLLSTKDVRQWYNSQMCTRIVVASTVDVPALIEGDGIVNDRLQDDTKWWNLLHIFGMQQYATVVFLKPTCLVVKDVSHLFHDLEVANNNTRCLLAAIPKQQQHPGDDIDEKKDNEFGTNIMILRPQLTVMMDMLTKLQSSSASSDASMTSSVDSFLNSYFDEEVRKLPPNAKLDPATYNVTQGPWENTNRDVDQRTDLYIVQFENDPDGNNDNVRSLFTSYYEGSKQYIQDQSQRKEKAKSKQIEREQHTQTREQTRRSTSSPSTVPTNDPMLMHKLVAKRYKELRREGKSAQEAMEQARADLVLSKVHKEGDGDHGSPGQKVAAMFGLNMR